MKRIQRSEAGDYLKAGYALIIIEDGTIVCLKEKKIHLQQANWHSTISIADFNQLYMHAHFGLYEQEAFIDEKKDEEYYQWRAKYQ